MDAIVKDFSLESVQNFISLVQKNEKILRTVTEKQMRLTLRKFVDTYIDITWDISEFFQILFVILATKKEFSEIVCATKSFLGVVFDFLVHQAQPSSAFKITLTLMEIFTIENEELIDSSNLNYFPRFNSFFMDNIHDHNDDEELKRLYTKVVIVFTVIIGSEELKRVADHQNKIDFYAIFLSLFNDEDDRKQLIPSLKFLSLLFSNEEVCDVFLFLSDFKVIMDVFLRELVNLCESEEPDIELFEEFVATLIDMIDSNLYVTKYEKTTISKVEESMKMLLESNLEKDEINDSCNLILETVDEVKKKEASDLLNNEDDDDSEDDEEEGSENEDDEKDEGEEDEYYEREVKDKKEKKKKKKKSKTKQTKINFGALVTRDSGTSKSKKSSKKRRNEDEDEDSDDDDILLQRRKRQEAYYRRMREEERKRRNLGRNRY